MTNEERIEKARKFYIHQGYGPNDDMDHVAEAMADYASERMAELKDALREILINHKGEWFLHTTASEKALDRAGKAMVDA